MVKPDNKRQEKGKPGQMQNPDFSRE